LGGPKGKHDPNRTAYRHGSQAATIPMGNLRLAMERPRVRSIETKQELPNPCSEAFASDDKLLEAALNRMLYGMSTRDFGHGIEDNSDVAEAGKGVRIGSTENAQVCIRSADRSNGQRSSSATMVYWLS